MARALVLLSWWLFSGVASANWQAPAFIEQSFYEVALGGEYRDGALKVRKWRQGIKLYVEHQVGDKKLHDQLLDAHLQHLEQITGVAITRVASRSAANVEYYFTSQQALPKLVRARAGKRSASHLRGAVCIATFSHNKRYEITSAKVFIPVDQARMHAKLLACIVEEITQVMGLPRDSEKVFPSIFNDRTPNNLLTGLDEILLRLLYSPSVKPGMSRQQLRPVLRKLIKQLQQQGQIATATSRVRSSELYQLLY